MEVKRVCARTWMGRRVGGVAALGLFRCRVSSALCAHLVSSWAHTCAEIVMKEVESPHLLGILVFIHLQLCHHPAPLFYVCALRFTA